MERFVLYRTVDGKLRYLARFVIGHETYPAILSVQDSSEALRLDFHSAQAMLALLLEARCELWEMERIK